MDFSFTLNGTPAEGISCWDRYRVDTLDVQSKERLRLVVDSFGRNSCKSQGLPAVITDLYRLQTSDHKLYLAFSQASGRLTVYGGIKTGVKRLFIRVETGAFCEIEPTCVLDFYVHEQYQRQGLGKQLFEHFLAAERQSAASIGYDRPSPKLLAFLRKHYGLANYIPQSNNFVVFSTYFQAVGQSNKPNGSSWTSVSQRPLTAKKRPNTRSACHPSQQASKGSLTGSHNGQSLAVPAFRTAASRGQSQRQPQPQVCFHQQQGQLDQSQTEAAATLPAEVQWGYDPAGLHTNSSSSSHVTRQQGFGSVPQSTGRPAGLHASSSLNSGIRGHVTRQQSSGSFMQPTDRPADRRTPGQMWPAAEAHTSARAKAAGLRSQGDVSLSKSSQGVSQAPSYPTAAPAVMYVKPPWAIDDPYQGKGALYSASHQQHSMQADDAESKPASPWSYQAAAGRQRSGSGARNCLIW